MVALTSSWAAYLCKPCLFSCVFWNLVSKGSQLAYITLRMFNHTEASESNKYSGMCDFKGCGTPCSDERETVTAKERVGMKAAYKCGFLELGLSGNLPQLCVRKCSDHSICVCERGRDIFFKGCDFSRMLAKSKWKATCANKDRTALPHKQPSDFCLTSDVSN